MPKSIYSKSRMFVTSVKLEITVICSINSQVLLLNHVAIQEKKTFNKNCYLSNQI